MTKHIPRFDEIQIGEHTYIPIEVAAKITGIPAQILNDLVCQGRVRAVCLGPIVVLERESVRQYKTDLEGLKKGSREERRRARQVIEARGRQVQEAV